MKGENGFLSKTSTSEMRTGEIVSQNSVRKLADPIVDMGIPSFFCTRENNFVIPKRAIRNPR